MGERFTLPWKTSGFLALAVVANSFGNLLLAMAMDRMPPFSATIPEHYLFLLLVNPYLLPGTLLTLVYMVSQLLLFSWADLSFVVPVLASSYIVTTVLSKSILKEHVSTERWVGVILITVGVALVTRTRPTSAHNGAR